MANKTLNELANLAENITSQDIVELTDAEANQVAGGPEAVPGSKKPDVTRHIVDKFTSAGINVLPDARALIDLAVTNQLRTPLIKGPDQLFGLLSQLTSDLVGAYTFKYGHRPLTLARTAALIADAAERWRELTLKGGSDQI